MAAHLSHRTAFSLQALLRPTLTGRRELYLGSLAAARIRGFRCVQDLPKLQLSRTIDLLVTEFISISNLRIATQQIVHSCCFLRLLASAVDCLAVSPCVCTCLFTSTMGLSCLPTPTNDVLGAAALGLSHAECRSPKCGGRETEGAGIPHGANPERCQGLCQRSASVVSDLRASALDPAKEVAACRDWCGLCGLGYPNGVYRGPRERSRSRS